MVSGDVEVAGLSAKQRAELERRRRLAQKRKAKKKKSKDVKKEEQTDEEADVKPEVDEGLDESTEGDEGEVEIEYVTEKPVEVVVDPNYIYFNRIFENFQIKEETKSDNAETIGYYDKMKKQLDAKVAAVQAGTKAAIVEQMLRDEEDMKKTKESEKLSRRKLRLSLRPTMSALKASCPRPDMVEWHDATARDPFLLVYLKSLRNTVPVPRHWNAKRKYLAGKRGFERPAFQLPEFIRKTGIMEMRQAVQEKEEHQTLKSMMRNRVRPKIGKIDIDYQKLHDAFFRYQTKPMMTQHGDIYYEGKEFEAQMRSKKPGDLSDDLRIALGMPIGPNAMKFPPPWLIAMQRYGPPPSYPHLKIPGLNAPIPEGCAFGYQAGGWGKPPVDEYGKPLYGDVFGVDVSNPSAPDDLAQVQHWGEMAEESEESESESEEEGDEVGETPSEVDTSGMRTPAAEGLVTPSGMTSGVVTGGLETPDSIELRKKGTGKADEGADTPSTVASGQKSLYTVLPEKKIDRIAGQMMASTHVYDVNAGKEKESRSSGGGDGGVEVSLNPDELGELGEEGLKKKYEEQLRKDRGDVENDQDFSDMVAEHAARQKRKRKTDDAKSVSKSNKKHKDFKF